MNTSKKHSPLLVKALKDPKASVIVGRQLLLQFSEQQLDRFRHKTPIQHLISERTNYIDQLLRRVWKHYLPIDTKLCLVAVGGYGRTESHPHSDIDILFLLDQTTPRPADCEGVSNFITYLWDIGLQVGHAIRTLEECENYGKNDLSTATNYTESRWLIGHYELFDQFLKIMKKPDFWPSQSFFLAKIAEQEVRHNKFQDALAQLEPNIKESPGGLRDIHTLLWIAKRHFGATSLQQLVSVEFLTVDEYNTLERAMRFHWRVRFVLHSLKQRKEERLLFDHQILVAKELGYQDDTGKTAVESFMQDYYRNARHIRRLNTLLIQHFREQFMPSDEQSCAINALFFVKSHYLGISDDHIFIQDPLNLLRVFYLLGEHHLQGINSKSQRLIQNYAHLINEHQCRQKETWDLFRSLLRSPKGVTKTLYAMHEQGILGRLFPAFHRITGLLQFDLFHAYTVDEHTLMVMKNLRRFLAPEPSTLRDFPLAVEIAKDLPHPDLLLLAGLFHDIAKGRGGDHSTLGAQDAYEFGQLAKLSPEHTELIRWLVYEHLTFSQVAQKKDITDPEIIAQFADHMKSPSNLKHLYLLTVADICATSPVVWNGWKDNLLKTLYQRTLSHMHQQKQTRPENQADQLLNNLDNPSQTRVIQIWQSFGLAHYVEKQSTSDLSRHLDLFVSSQPLPHLVMAHTHMADICNLAIYTHNNPEAWLNVTFICGQHRLNILDAQIYTSNQHTLLIDLKFIQPDIWSTEHQQTFTHELSNCLSQGISKPELQDKWLSRKKINLNISTKVQAKRHEKNHQWLEIQLSTRDRFGLLNLCAQVFYRHQLQLISAKATTEGLRAKDNFLLSHNLSADMQNEQIKQIQQDLIRTLGQQI